MKRIVLGVVVAVLLGGVGTGTYFALRTRSGGQAPPAAPGPGETSAAPVELTDATLASATAGGLVLVDFWSPQCPPCRMQGPIVDSLAGRFAGRATIAKLNVNDNPKAAGQFDIMYIPTLILFKDGKEVKRLTGLQKEPVLAVAVEDVLKNE